MKKILFFCLLLPPLLLSGQTYNEDYAKGVKMYKAQYYDSALYVFENLNKSELRSDSIMNYLGMTYYKLKDTVSSYDCFYKSLKINPLNPKTFFYLGTNYLNEQRYDSAYFYFNLAIATDKSYLDAYNNRGLVYLHREDYNAAKNDFYFVLNQGGKSNRIYYNLGIAEHGLGNNKESTSYYTKAIKMDKLDYMSYWNRSIVYIELKEYNKALSDIDQVYKLCPTHIDLYINRGNVYTELKKYPEAINEYSSYINLNPNDGEAYANRGYCKILINDYTGCKDIKKAISLGFEEANELLNEYCK